MHFKDTGTCDWEQLRNLNLYTCTCNLTQNASYSTILDCRMHCHISILYVQCTIQNNVKMKTSTLKNPPTLSVMQSLSGLSIIALGLTGHVTTCAQTLHSFLEAVPGQMNS